MKTHQLELFFHVARHGGISAAARRMPYGIQQPAISLQIQQLEDSLGILLFVRRPFELTAEGQLLYDFITPFFGGLDEVARRLRGGGLERLRIASPALVQRDYLPELFARVKRREPRFQFTLRQNTGQDTDMLGGEFEISLEMLSGRPAAGRHSRELGRLPMILLIPETCTAEAAADLWRDGRGTAPLIALAKDEPMCQAFQAELRKREIAWPTSLELGNLDLVARYVTAGHGIGLGLRLPEMQLPHGVRELPLTNFQPLTFAAVWTGTLPPLAGIFVEEAGTLARELFGK